MHHNQTLLGCWSRAASRPEQRRDTPQMQVWLADPMCAGIPAQRSKHLKTWPSFLLARPIAESCSPRHARDEGVRRCWSGGNSWGAPGGGDALTERCAHSLASQTCYLALSVIHGRAFRLDFLLPRTKRKWRDRVETGLENGGKAGKRNEVDKTASGRVRQRDSAHKHERQGDPRRV